MPAYQKVNDETRRRIHKLHADGVSYQLIGRRMGISTSHVKYIIERAKRVPQEHTNVSQG